MSDYLDRTYAVIDGTILHYAGKDTALNIPEKFANMPVLCIGKGAFMYSYELCQATLPQGIEKICQKAFQNCKLLESVTIPGTVKTVEQNAFSDCPALTSFVFRDVEVSREEYNSLMLASAKIGDGCYLLRHFPDIKLIKQTVQAAGIAPAYSVQFGTEKIFTSRRDLAADKGAAAMFGSRGCFDLHGIVTSANEKDSFTEMIASDTDTPSDPASEQANDRFCRCEKYPTIPETAMIILDDKETMHKDGRYHLTFKADIGFHFWQSKLPITYDGMQYFIYRRNYLSSDAGLSYIRKDVAIFKGQALVMAQKEAYSVYAKYRLLTML